MLHCTTISGLTKIVNGKPIRSKAVLDSLFNTFAPELNAGLAQAGYNSLAEMRTAIAKGEVNVTNFLEGLSMGCNVVEAYKNKDGKNKQDFSETFGAEIPIDVISSCKFDNNVKTPDQMTQDAELIKKYSKKSTPLQMIIKGHIKNPNAEYWELNNILYKIRTTMDNIKPIHVRIGKHIYENCYVKNFQSEITNLYDISFTMELYYVYPKEADFNALNKRGLKLNPDETMIETNRALYDAMQDEVNLGIFN